MIRARTNGTRLKGQLELTPFALSPDQNLLYETLM